MQLNLDFFIFRIAGLPVVFTNTKSASPKRGVCTKFVYFIYTIHTCVWTFIILVNYFVVNCWTHSLHQLTFICNVQRSLATHVLLAYLSICAHCCVLILIFKLLNIEIQPNSTFFSQKFEWGPKFFKMGTKWGPHFEWNGDLWQQKWGPNGDLVPIWSRRKFLKPVFVITSNQMVDIR